MYKIYNCLGEQVGNPRGYKTHRGALSRLSRFARGSVFDAIWDAYNLEVQSNPSLCVAYTIKWED